MKHLALVVLAIIVFAICFPLALAQEAIPNNSKPSPSPLEYTLPFPGILPNHPLYGLKLLRDKLLSNLISNPIRQVEFAILLADKRLNAGVFLFHQGQKPLAVKTLLETKDIFKRAQNKILTVPAETYLEVGNLKEKLQKSLEKHLEVVGELKDQADGKEKEQLTQLFTDLNTFYQDFKLRK